MSTPASSPGRSRGQQTLFDAALTKRAYSPLTGVLPRIELPDPEFEDWLAGNREVTSVVLNFSDATAVIERDGDLQQVLEPWQLPVIVGTEDDELVATRTLQDVLDVLTVAQPAIYVPDAVFNYKSMARERQFLAVRAYLDHLEAVQELVLDHELRVRLLPTNKGWSASHFELYRDLFDRYDYSEFAYYAVQYTGADAGNARRQLRRHISHVNAVLDPTNIFVIGRLAKHDLLRFPPVVRGACGLRQWQDACAVRDGYAQEPWPGWADEHQAALMANNGQQQRHLSDYGITTTAN